MSFVNETQVAAWGGLTSTREDDYTRWQVIRWWEHRRIYYNFMLLCVGLISVVGFEYVGGLLVSPGEDAIEPMVLFIAVPLFAFTANALYTLGWGTDLILKKKRPSVRLLVAGYIFSIFVTLVPFFWIFMLFSYKKLTGHMF